MTFPFNPSFPAAASTVTNQGSTRLGGLSPPKITTGKYYPPPFANINLTVNAMNSTATRLQYWPFYIREVRSYQSVAVYNSGAGDNGETYRLGWYDDNGATGGPGTLLKAYAQGTLTGAAALREFADAWTPNSIGWKWFAFHTNSAAGWLGYQTVSGTPIIEDSGSDLGAYTVANNYSQTASYVDTTYGALASTAVAPTAGVILSPAFWLRA